MHESLRKQSLLDMYVSSVQTEKRLTANIEQYRESRLGARAMCYDGMPRGSGHSDLSDYMIRIEEMLEDLQTQKKNTEALKRDIEDKLIDIDEREAEVIRRKFLLGQTVKDIASCLLISTRTVYRLLKEAGELLKI